jgi:hypothetical protein
MGKILNKHFSKEDTVMAIRSKKKYLASLIIRKMQIKTAMTVRMTAAIKIKANKFW